MQRQVWTFLGATLASLLVVAIATPANAQALGPVHRFSAEFQFAPPGPTEIVTVATPLPGGKGGQTVYSKTLFIPYRTLFVTFSATGDTHNGAALLMTCVVDGVVCQSAGGLPSAGPSGWITLQKMPAGHTGNNCNDGGGGTGLPRQQPQLHLVYHCGRTWTPNRRTEAGLVERWSSVLRTLTHLHRRHP